MRKISIYGWIVVIGFLLMMTGCAAKKMDTVRQDTNHLAVAEAVKPAPGAIWRSGTDKGMLFVDHKAREVNDIVTIIVSETSQGGNRASTGTSRDSATAASITSLLGIENAILGSNANMAGTISLGGSHKNSLKGQGDTSRNTTLSARISARVIRVLDNGNLMIEGRRQVTVNAEDQYIIISGIIRPADITTENTIASQYVADARIVYTGQGVVNDKMRPGWMTRVVDWVWPF
jgi:flagellar L-ring protein precursor FlgH